MYYDPAEHTHATVWLARFPDGYRVAVVKSYESFHDGRPADFEDAQRVWIFSREVLHTTLETAYAEACEVFEASQAGRDIRPVTFDRPLVESLSRADAKNRIETYWRNLKFRGA